MQPPVGAQVCLGVAICLVFTKSFLVLLVVEEVSAWLLVMKHRLSPVMLRRPSKNHRSLHFVHGNFNSFTITRYWRGKAGEWKKAAEAAKEELDEFQEGSRELEHELETQLEQAEMKNKDLKALTNRLQMENEQLRDKLEQCSRDYHFQVIRLSRIICVSIHTFSSDK